MGVNEVKALRTDLHAEPLACGHGGSLASWFLPAPPPTRMQRKQAGPPCLPALRGPFQLRGAMQRAGPVSSFSPGSEQEGHPRGDGEGEGGGGRVVAKGWSQPPKAPSPELQAVGGVLARGLPIHQRREFKHGPNMYLLLYKFI